MPSLPIIYDQPRRHCLLFMTSHAVIAYFEQVLPQRMVVAYDKLVGIKTPLLKEIRNTYMEPEAKTLKAHGQ